MGTLVLPPSSVRNESLTRSESSQFDPGPTFSHMCLNVWRRALGISSKTRVESLKRFNCSSVYKDLTRTISDAEWCTLPLKNGEGFPLRVEAGRSS